MGRERGGRGKGQRRILLVYEVGGERRGEGNRGREERQGKERDFFFFFFEDGVRGERCEEEKGRV